MPSVEEHKHLLGLGILFWFSKLSQVCVYKDPECTNEWLFIALIRLIWDFHSTPVMVWVLTKEWFYLWTWGSDYIQFKSMWMWVSVGLYMSEELLCQLQRQSEQESFWVPVIVVFSFVFYFHPNLFLMGTWNLWVSPALIRGKMIQFKTVHQLLFYLMIGVKFLDCTDLKSTFEQTGSVLHACNQLWNEAKALSVWFHCRHLAAHHYISVHRISIVVINVGSLQPTICSGDKMSCIIASKRCDLETILPCIFLKACVKQLEKLTLQGTSSPSRFRFCSFPSLLKPLSFEILLKVNMRRCAYCSLFLNLLYLQFLSFFVPSLPAPPSLFFSFGGCCGWQLLLPSFSKLVLSVAFWVKGVPCSFESIPLTRENTL